jgi:hypothetical protein
VAKSAACTVRRLGNTMFDGAELVAMVLTGVPGQVAEAELRKISSNLKRKTTRAIGAQQAAERR